MIRHCNNSILELDFGPIVGEQQKNSILKLNFGSIVGEQQKNSILKLNFGSIVGEQQKNLIFNDLLRVKLSLTLFNLLWE